MAARTTGMNTAEDWKAQRERILASLRVALQAMSEGVYDLDGFEDDETRRELAGVRVHRDRLEWALQGALMEAELDPRTYAAAELSRMDAYAAEHELGGWTRRTAVDVARFDLS